MPFIHFNLPLSLNAGAIYPGQLIRDIAALADVPLYWGNECHYGNDYMGLPPEPTDVAIVLELLTESKLCWELVDKLPGKMQHLAD